MTKQSHNLDERVLDKQLGQANQRGPVCESRAVAAKARVYLEVHSSGSASLSGSLCHSVELFGVGEAEINFGVHCGDEVFGGRMQPSQNRHTDACGPNLQGLFDVCHAQVVDIGRCECLGNLDDSVAIGVGLDYSQNHWAANAGDLGAIGIGWCEPVAQSGKVVRDSIKVNGELSHQTPSATTKAMASPASWVMET